MHSAFVIWSSSFKPSAYQYSSRTFLNHQNLMKIVQHSMMHHSFIKSFF
ncbi:hypothetical protein X975_05517, partial [Stegodyphus mimosarum]